MKIKFFINEFIKGTSWYRSIFNDARRILDAPYNLDIINFGSNPAKFDINYSEATIRGYNFAVGPQCMKYDYKLLQHYSNHLSPNGKRILLLLLFCPFSFCKDDYHLESDGEIAYNDRYYSILPNNEISNFNQDRYNKLFVSPLDLGMRLYKNLILFYLKNLKKCYSFSQINLEKSAEEYLSSWKKEFFLDNFEVSKISKQVKSSLTFNNILLNKEIDYCKKNNINLFIIVPPISKYISGKIPNEFCDFCFWNILKEKSVTIIDYSKSELFTQDYMFRDALCLNKAGSIKFSNHLIDFVLNIKKVSHNKQHYVVIKQ